MPDWVPTRDEIVWFARVDRNISGAGRLPRRKAKILSGCFVDGWLVEYRLASGVKEQMSAYTGELKPLSPLEALALQAED